MSLNVDGLPVGTFTYKIQVATEAAGTAFVNRSEADTDAAAVPRLASTITLREIGA